MNRIKKKFRNSNRVFHTIYLAPCTDLILREVDLCEEPDEEGGFLVTVGPTLPNEEPLEFVFDSLAQARRFARSYDGSTTVILETLTLPASKTMRVLNILGVRFGASYSNGILEFYASVGEGVETLDAVSGIDLRRAQDLCQRTGFQLEWKCGKPIDSKTDSNLNPTNSQR